MRLLITRPAQDTAALKTRLEQRGHTVVTAPLLHIHYRSGTFLSPAGVQALLATSANGVRALVARPSFRKWLSVPLMAVGPATAYLSREAGFLSVYDAAGDTRSLAALIRKQCRPDGGRLLHLSGHTVAGDLQVMLEEDGFQVERAVIYDAVARTLPEPVKNEIIRGEIEGVLFYSRRTAEIFVNLTRGHVFDRTYAFCLSGHVAGILASCGFRRLCIAPEPNEMALMHVIGKTASI